MLNSADDWGKYRACIRDFDAILEHARAVSASLAGLTPNSVHLGYAEQIYVKLIVHGITLRTLAPHPTKRRVGELWDLGSMCAVARCLIEALDALLYISDTGPTQEERDFRLQLWLLHDQTRRSKMLNAIGSTHQQADEIRLGASERTASIQTHPYFANLKPNHRKSICEGDPPVFHLSQRERCVAKALDYNYFNTATMHLSQYVHTLPHSVHQLFEFKAGNPDLLHLMSLPFQYTLPFICAAAAEMQTLFPDRTPEPPSRVRTKMKSWKAFASAGFDK